MTALQTHPAPFLEVTVADDHMELSSEVDRLAGAGEDIDVDVDLDLASDRAGDDDEDYIIEDARSELADDRALMSEAVNDDVMHDEDRPLSNMGDDNTYHDEELGDVDDLTQAPAANIPTEISNPSATDTALAAEIHVRPDSAQDIHESGVSTNTSYPASGGEAILETTIESHDPDSAVTKEAVDETDYEPEDPSVPHPMAPIEQSLGSDSLRDPPPHSKPRNPDLQPDGEDSHAVANVHPVVVGYEGSEVSLFPPSKDDSSETFFLQDESLAGASISELFAAIRGVLADSIGQDDELEMTLEELGLSLTEDSQHAQRVTLSQILDLHVQLLHHDGIDHPDALYMTLTSKAGFHKRLNSLTEAVGDGKGMSQVKMSTHEHVAKDTADEPEADSHNVTTFNEHEDDRKQAEVVDGNPAPSVAAVKGQDENTATATALDGSLESNDDAANGGAEGEASQNEPQAAAALAASGSEDKGPRSGALDKEAGDGVEEEGDLIDYEEEEEENHEEGGVQPRNLGSNGSSTVQGDDPALQDGTFTDFITPCYIPQMCFCARCNDLILAEYAASNEADSRRGSLTGEDKPRVEHHPTLAKEQTVSDALGQSDEPTANGHDTEPTQFTDYVEHDEGLGEEVDEQVKLADEHEGVAYDEFTLHQPSDETLQGHYEETQPDGFDTQEYFNAGSQEYGQHGDQSTDTRLSDDQANLLVEDASNILGEQDLEEQGLEDYTNLLDEEAEPDAPTNGFVKQDLDSVRTLPSDTAEEGGVGYNAVAEQDNAEEDSIDYDDDDHDDSGLAIEAKSSKRMRADDGEDELQADDSQGTYLRVFISHGFPS